MGAPNQPVAEMVRQVPQSIQSWGRCTVLINLVLSDIPLRSQGLTTTMVVHDNSAECVNQKALNLVMCLAFQENIVNAS